MDGGVGLGGHPTPRPLVVVFPAVGLIDVDNACHAFHPDRDVDIPVFPRNFSRCFTSGVGVLDCLPQTRQAV